MEKRGKLKQINMEDDKTAEKSGWFCVSGL